jgi:hypothetical protein|tara:strand:- start:3089 stop:4021 length:933 start_codon:yes stop_codon:yes gene_type:complete
MIPSEMVTDFKNHLDALDGFFDGAEIMRRLHSAQQELCRKIVEEDPSFFIETTTLDLVAGQETYALPVNARLGSRIVMAENLSDALANDTNGPLPAAQLRDYFSFQGAGTLVDLHPFYSFMMEGNNIRIEPTPNAASAAAVRIWYVPSYGNMIEGFTDGASPTTITFSDSIPNYAATFGVVDRRNDFYNGMTVQIVSGNGVGQYRRITDYDGLTRTATVESAWGSTPTSSGDDVSKYAVVCPVPEDHHSAVTVRAAMEGAIKNRNRFGELQALFFGSPGRQGLMFDLLAWISKRQDQKLETVYPANYNGY